MAVQEKVKESASSTPRPVRQSVIKEWTEEQLLTILVELASSSPEANALLRDVQERVEEYLRSGAVSKDITEYREELRQFSSQNGSNLVVLVML